MKRSQKHAGVEESDGRILKKRTVQCTSGDEDQGRHDTQTSLTHQAHEETVSFDCSGIDSGHSAQPLVAANDDCIGMMEPYVDARISCRLTINIDRNASATGRPSPPLSLQAQVSLFDNIVLREIVDTELLDQIIASNSTLSQCQWLLPRYRTSITAGKACVEYTKPQFGRAIVTGSLGLHNMERRLRHTLARHNFTDWDMTNAHPTILLQICQAHEITCEELQFYVDNREACLVEVMTHYGVSRHQAKDLYLRMMFLGGFKAWAKDQGLQNCFATPRLKSYSRELRRIATAIIQHNPAVAEYVKRQGYKYFEASVLSTFLQEVECRLLETLIRHCLGNGLIQDNVAVLCNDGFMLETALSRPELAAEFNRLILETHGFDIEFTTKSMDEFIPPEQLRNDATNQATAPVPSPLTLSPRLSHLDGITLNEPFDYIKASRLLDSTIQFDSTVLEFGSANAKRPAKASREKLEDYIRQPTVRLSEKEYARVQYQRDRYGRCSPKRSGVQSMTKKIRHHLVAHELVDIDTVNSGASLLYNIVRLHPIEFGTLTNFPVLTRYVTRREEMLEEIMRACTIDREKAKKLVISVMHGGGRPHWLYSCAIAQEFKAEMARIAEIVVKANPDLADFVRRRKQEKQESLSNLNGSVLAYYIFEWEHLVNETVYLYLKEGGYLVNDVCVLAYDGLMIPREHYHDGLLQELRTEVGARLNFDLQFVAKPMTEGVTEEQVAASQAVPLTDTEILSMRPKHRATLKPRNLPSWVPAQDEMQRLINSHPFFAGAMSVTKKGDGHVYFMRPVIGATAWKCPIRADCSGSAGGFTQVTEQGLRYYCQGEECKKPVAETGQRKFFPYHLFEARTQLEVEEMNVEPQASPAVSTQAKEERIRQANCYKFLKWKTLKDSTRVPTNGDCYYAEGMKPIPSRDLDHKKGDTIFVKGPMSEGKTIVLKQLLSDLEAYYTGKGPFNAVSLVSRKSLCAEQASKLEHFVQYYDTKGPLNDHKTIVQLEAAHRCEPPNGLQLLILDEAIGLMEQIRSGKFTKASWRKFKLMLKVADHVIVMDANINDRLIRLIQRFRKDRTSLFYQNTNQRDRDTTVYHCRDRRIIVSRVIQCVRSGKNVVIATNSKVEADAFDELIVETLGLKTRDKVFNYSSDTAEAIKRQHFSDVNHHWSQLEVLIYTPTVNVGVSFEAQHFDEVFAIFTDCSTTAESSIQMMKRVRDVKSRRLHVCFHNCLQEGKLPTSAEDIHAYLLRTLNSSQIEYDPQHLLDWKVSPSDFKTVQKIKRDGYYDTLLYLIAQANESKNDFAARFIALGIENQGWLPERVIEMGEEYCRVHGLTKESLAADNRVLREAKKTATNKQHREIADARNLSNKEATYLERKVEQHEFLEQHERVELRKYKFAQFYGLGQATAIVTPHYYATYQPIKIARAYRNQCIAFQNGPENVAILQYLHEIEKQLLSAEQVQSDEQDEFTFAALTTRRRFDEFRYALIIVSRLGLRHIWDSPNFQEVAAPTSLLKAELRQVLYATFTGLWSEIRDYAGKPIFVVAVEQQQPVLNNSTTNNNIHRFFLQTDEWKEKNRQHNIEYMLMLYDLRRNDLQEWSDKISFASILGLANSILKRTFGIKLSPLSSNERKRYVLRHCYHFRNSRFTSRPEEKGNGVRPAEWPNLDRREPVLPTIQVPERVELLEATAHQAVNSVVVLVPEPVPSCAQSSSSPENRSAEESSRRPDQLDPVVVTVDNPKSRGKPLGTGREKAILAGLQAPTANKKKRYGATRKSYSQTTLIVSTESGAKRPFQGILASDAFYAAIETEVEKLVSSQRKIENLKSTFRDLYRSYNEMNARQPASFESQYASNVAASGRAKNSIFVLMRDYLRNLST